MISRKCPVCGREYEEPVERCECGTDRNLIVIYPM